jgi:hypothetical protein
VQDLWGLCVDVINRMAKDFPDADMEEDEEEEIQ